jgi:hypothetical protein
VTGRIRDIRQNVIQYSVQAGSRSSPSYCHIFFLIAFLEEAFIRKTIIIMCINYTITVHINYNNNAASNNDYERLQHITLFLKIPMGRRKNFFEIYIQLGQAPSSRFPSPGFDLKNDFFPSIIMTYTKFSLRMVYNTPKHVGEI